MNISPETIVETIQKTVKDEIKNIVNMLSVRIDDPTVKDDPSKFLNEAWKIVEEHYLVKWTPGLEYSEEEVVETWLKQNMSLHNVNALIKKEFKENFLLKLGIDKDSIEIDPDVFEKVEELSFEANIAYTTLLSMINEHLELFLAKPYEDENILREEVEDFWLNEVYERVMIEYIQYGTKVVHELDAFAKSKNYFDGFSKGMMHDVYKQSFEEKLNEIKMISNL